MLSVNRTFEPINQRVLVGVLVRWVNLAGRIGDVVFVVSAAVTLRSSAVVVVGWTGGKAGEGSAGEGCPAGLTHASSGKMPSGPPAAAATPPV